MGGDGGSIPRRIELVKTKKRDEQLQRDFEVSARWKLCALSQEPLVEPLVTCQLGRLYLKEALIEALLNKTLKDNENCSHIRSLKETKELNLTTNPAYEPGVADKGDRYKDYNVSPFICPVVGLEMNGKYRFCVIWSCGCVMSERSLKEVPTEICHKCGKKYEPADIVVLNGTEEEMDSYRDRIAARREEQRLRKAEKKGQTQSDVGNTPGCSTDGVKKAKKRKPEEIKKEKEDANSVQDDPKASKVFKSLFTSCEEAKNAPKAHWVTYNPLYN